MEDFTDITLLEAPLLDGAGFMQLLLRFAFNMLVIFGIIQFFYYSKSKRRDYYFTFTLISISVFFLIFLLGSVKLKIGFALGLFAIFGIIRYRTESVPIREMTYLFVIIAISVINALAVVSSAGGTTSKFGLILRLRPFSSFTALSLKNDLDLKVVTEYFVDFMDSSYTKENKFFIISSAIFKLIIRHVFCLNLRPDYMPAIFFCNLHFQIRERCST